MKRYFALFLIFIAAAARSEAAVYELDELLDAQLRRFGAFDGEEGVFYASAERFDGETSLFTANFNGGELGFSVLGCSDGPQVTDTRSFPVGGKNKYVLSLAAYGPDTAVVLTVNGRDETYIMKYDSFVRSSYKPELKTKLAVFENGRLYPANEPNVFSVLKGLKNKRIESSAHCNAVNGADAGKKEKIKRLLGACADVMSFDINAPDIDRLMIYMLNTHKNFADFADVPAAAGGSGNVRYVSEAFADSIIRDVFGCEPPKPPPEELSKRGYCAAGGRYYYSKAFNVDFSTEVIDITVLYELGGGVCYTVFSDVYHRGGEEIEEYSFAVVDMSEGGNGRLLRLGMGEALLSDGEISEYAPVSIENNYFYTGIPCGKYIGVNAAARVILAVCVLAAAVSAVNTARIWRRMR